MTTNFPDDTYRLFHVVSSPYKAEGKTLHFLGALILTATPVRQEVMINAWTHALRYSAKGLDLPDFEAAIKLLLERHPSWEFVGYGDAKRVAANLQSAGEDIPE